MDLALTQVAHLKFEAEAATTTKDVALTAKAEGDKPASEPVFSRTELAVEL